MPDYPLVVDASHYQGKIDIPALQAAGIVAVIAKATEINAQSGSVDAYYASNKALLESAGILHGGYCFLDPPAPDGNAQADLFLKTAGLDGDTLIALDLEAAGDTLAEAEQFVSRVHDVTGIWPLLYTGAYVIDRISGHNSEILAKCFLWLADHNPTPIVPLPWRSWTLLQYSSINLGGVTYDLNRYNGSLDGLRMVWKLTSPAIAGTVDAIAVNDGDIVALKTPGGEFHSFIRPGTTVTVITSSAVQVAGRWWWQSPQDFWIDSGVVPSIPLPPPPTVPPFVPKPMVATASLNVRSAAVIDPKNVLVTIAQGTTVTVTGPGVGGTYDWTPITVTYGGKTYQGYVSANFLK